MKIRRLFVRVLTPLLALAFAIAPSQSYAFVPAAVGGYGLPTLPTTGSYAAASGSAPLAVGAAAFAVGMAIGYYGLEYMLGDGTPEHVRIPLTTAPALAVPAPAAPAAASPTTQYCLTGWGCSTGTLFSSASSACASVHNPFTGGYIYGLWDSGGSICNNWSHYDAGGSDVIVGQTAIYSGSKCPSGYTGTTTCALSDARAATPDNACDYVRSGTSLTGASSADPDCNAALLKMPFVCANGTCSGQGLDASGSPQNYLVTPRADGGSTLKTQVQKTVNGQTQVQTTTVGVSPAGVVDSVSGDVQPGSIPLSTDGSATAPAASTSATQQASQGQITLPTDYARTGEAAAAAQPIATAIQAQTAADQAWRDGEQARKDADKGAIPTPDLIPKQTVNISYSPVSFASSASCPAPVGFNVFGHDYSISYDPLCNVMSFMRPIFLAAGAMAAAAIFIGGLKT